MAITGAVVIAYSYFTSPLGCGILKSEVKKGHTKCEGEKGYEKRCLWNANTGLL